MPLRIPSTIRLRVRMSSCATPDMLATSDVSAARAPPAPCYPLTADPVLGGSGGAEAAVDGQGGAVDVGRLIADEEHHSLPDALGCAHAPGRCAPDDRGDAVGEGQVPLGGGRAGRDGVDPDTSGSVLGGQDLVSEWIAALVALY